MPNKRESLDGIVCLKAKELQNGESVKNTLKSSRFGKLSMK